MLKMFQLVGQDLFVAGINNSHSGNLSVRKGNHLIITRRGSMLAHLEAKDLIETGIDEDDEYTGLASTEIGVHRGIYQHTSAQAIVHAHPVYATAFSVNSKEIIPVDAEGAYLLKKVPVLAVAETIGSAEVAERLPELLQQHPIVMVKGHGSFAVGQDLEAAFKLTNSLENACKIAYFAQALK